MFKYFYAMWLPLVFAISCASISVYLLPLSFIGVLDCISRIAEMRRLQKKKFNKRVAYYLRRARCQRNVYVGIHGRKAREYYKNLGYRWYHIVPDDMVQNPLLFFSPKYIRATYFSFI